MNEERAIKHTYDLIAKTYHEERTVLKRGSYFFNECIEMPTTLALLGDVRGKRVLDLGCGTGIYAKKLLKKGAYVCGVERSKGMLAIARKYAKGAEFQEGSVYKIPYPEGYFDVVLSALVIDHVQNLAKMFKEVKRVLKSDGYFIFSAPNPITECRVLARIGKQQYRILGYRRDKERIFGDYFTERWNEATVGPSLMYHYHRTYETILNNMLRAGFKLIAYKDAAPIKKRIPSKEWRRIRNVFSKIPIFYAIKAQAQ